MKLHQKIYFTLTNSWSGARGAVFDALHLPRSVLAVEQRSALGNCGKNATNANLKLRFVLEMAAICYFMAKLKHT